MDLYHRNGDRKYLTPEEREKFWKAAEAAPREVRTFCGTLFYTGCRITEALELTAARIDLTDRRSLFEKSRKRGLQGRSSAARLPRYPRSRSQHQGGPETLGQGPQGHAVGLVPDDRLYPCAGSHAGGRHHRTPCCAEGLEAWVRRQCDRERRAAEQAAKVAGTRQPQNIAIYADAGGAEEDRIAERLWWGNTGRATGTRINADEMDKAALG